MATFTKFDCYTENLAEKVHDLDLDSIRVYLTNATPNVATHTVKADLAEITIQNGYTGPLDVSASTSRSGGLTTISGVDQVWTASGGSFGPFRYAVFYNDTAVNDPLIGYIDYGSSITPGSGSTVTVDFNTALHTIGPA